MKYRNLVIILMVAAALAGIIGAAASVGKSRENPTVQNTESSPPVVTTTPSAGTTSTNGQKTYTNNEYGFEFQYPHDWSIFEEPHGLGFYSKFELVAAPNVGESNENPFLINVVLPEFADRTFLG